MNILHEGAELLSQHLGIEGQTPKIMEALSDLFEIANTEIDLRHIIHEMLHKNNLQQLIVSWLGDREHRDAFNVIDVVHMFGSDKIAEFSSKIGAQRHDVATALAAVLPQMLNRAKAGGTILEHAVDGLGSLLNKGKDFLK